jgi:site-specific recombinase XerD
MPGCAMALRWRDVDFAGSAITVSRAISADVETSTKSGRDAAGLRPLRFHDRRHTYGSLLAAAGVDLVTIQAAMGHGALVTTGRYLHARPARDQATIFTRAFQAAVSADELLGIA